MRVAGLFAGIGGLELGLERQGHSTCFLCEIDPGAQAVLELRFPRIPLVPDVREIDRFSQPVDLVTAGFPCQDLSQAGATRGITGSKSGVVEHLFRILRVNDVPNVLIENVPFMLQLQKGQAIRHLVSSLEALGYSWAYRVVDARCFGLPQRRERVYLLASKVLRPWDVLFRDESNPMSPVYRSHMACGFYWTEGVRGLGWAVDAIPTLKGGSNVGIPSPPGVWLPGGRIVRPTILAGERLQGFEPGWTEPSEAVVRKGMRWKLVGNSVSVMTSTWLGDILKTSCGNQEIDLTTKIGYLDSNRWPNAAFGAPGVARRAVQVSKWPRRERQLSLAPFLGDQVEDLSLKAVNGFIGRLESSSLRYSVDFMNALLMHRCGMAQKAMA